MKTSGFPIQAAPLPVSKTNGSINLATLTPSEIIFRLKSSTTKISSTESTLRNRAY